MKSEKLQLNIKSFFTSLAIIVFAVIVRLIPHPANFAPITALALFGGAYLSKKNAFIVPLMALFFSDMLIGFHNTMPFVYGSFLISGLLGLWLKKHHNVVNTTLITLIASLQFFLVTNLGVWFIGTIYPKTVDGLLQAYIMGIPFYRNTLLGDLFYTGLFFSAYELFIYIFTSKAENSKLKIQNHN